MKKHLLLLLVITLFSCNRQSDFEKKLIKSKWVMFEGKSLTDELDRWPSDYVQFYDNDSLRYFDITGSLLPQIDNEGTIINEPVKWSYIPNSKEMIINGHKLKVMSIEGDTILMVKDTSYLMLYNIDKTHAKLKKGPGRCLGG